MAGRWPTIWGGLARITTHQLSIYDLVGEPEDVVRSGPAGEFVRATAASPSPVYPSYSVHLRLPICAGDRIGHDHDAVRAGRHSAERRRVPRVGGAVAVGHGDRRRAGRDAFAVGRCGRRPGHGAHRPVAGQAVGVSILDTVVLLAGGSARLPAVLDRDCGKLS